MINPDNPEACAAWIKNAGFCLKDSCGLNTLCLFQRIDSLRSEVYRLTWSKNPLTPVWVGDDFSARLSAWDKALEVRDEALESMEDTDAAFEAFDIVEKEQKLGPWVSGTILQNHFSNGGDQSFAPYVETALAYVMTADLKALQQQAPKIFQLRGEKYNINKIWMLFASSDPKIPLEPKKTPEAREDMYQFQMRFSHFLPKIFKNESDRKLREMEKLNHPARIYQGNAISMEDARKFFARRQEESGLPPEINAMGPEAFQKLLDSCALVCSKGNDSILYMLQPMEAEAPNFWGCGDILPIVLSYAQSKAQYFQDLARMYIKAGMRSMAIYLGEQRESVPDLPTLGWKILRDQSLRKKLRICYFDRERPEQQRTLCGKEADQQIQAYADDIHAMHEGLMQNYENLIAGKEAKIEQARAILLGRYGNCAKSTQDLRNALANIRIAIDTYNKDNFLARVLADSFLEELAGLKEPAALPLPPAAPPTAQELKEDFLDKTGLRLQGDYWQVNNFFLLDVFKCPGDAQNTPIYVHTNLSESPELRPFKCGSDPEKKLYKALWKQMKAREKNPDLLAFPKGQSLDDEACMKNWINNAGFIGHFRYAGAFVGKVACVVLPYKPQMWDVPGHIKSVESAEKTLQALKTYQELQDEIKALNKEIQNLEARRDKAHQLQDEIKALTASIETTQKDLEAGFDKNHRLEGEIKTLTASIETTQKDLEAQLDKAHRLEGANQAWIARIKGEQKDLEARIDKVHRLEGEIKAWISVQKELESQIDKNRKAKDKLELLEAQTIAEAPEEQENLDQLLERKRALEDTCSNLNLEGSLGYILRNMDMEHVEDFLQQLQRATDFAFANAPDA